MVSFRFEKQAETWTEHAISWTRKPRTQEEHIELWLCSGDLHELLSAMDALEKQGPEASRLLRSIVQYDARKCREGKVQLRLGLVLVAVAALSTLCWSVATTGIFGGATSFLLLLIWLTSPWTLSWYEDYRMHGRRLKNSVALLHRIPESSAAAEMLEALDAGDTRTNSLAAKSLAQLLPLLTEAEGTLLQGQHHAALRRALRGYNSELILAILQASDKILDQTAIPDVKWLTHCPDWFAESDKIQVAACSSLAHLEADSLRRETGRSLLRPAAPSGPEELLHPASGVSQVPTHQMLRADNATELTEE